MKVVFFNSCKNWGGGEKWHHEVAVALQKNEFNVILFSNKGSLLFKKAQQDHVPVLPVKVSARSFLNPFRLWRLVNQFRKLNPDAVILNLSADVKFAGIAAWLAGVKTIIYRRGSAIPIKNTFLNRFLFRKIITHVIANSVETANTIVVNNQNLFDFNKIKVIYNGIDIDAYGEIYSGDNSEPVIGNLARLSKQKGQDYLINLANGLKNKGYRFKLLIGGSGELEGELKEKVQKLNLETHVKFVGFVDNIPGFFNSIDLFVFPSIWEGFGFSIIEAKLMQKPVVAFNVSSNPEVIRDHVDGFLVPAFNEDELLSKVELLISDAEKRKNMGQNGRNDVVSRFSKDKMIATVKAYLYEIVG